MPRRKSSTGTRTFVVPSYLVVTVDADGAAGIGEIDTDSITTFLAEQFSGEGVEFYDVDGEDVCGTLRVHPVDAYETGVIVAGETGENAYGAYIALRDAGLGEIDRASLKLAGITL